MEKNVEIKTNKKTKIYNKNNKKRRSLRKLQKTQENVVGRKRKNLRKISKNCENERSNLSSPK